MSEDENTPENQTHLVDILEQLELEDNGSFFFQNLDTDGNLDMDMEHQQENYRQIERNINHIMQKTYVKNLRQEFDHKEKAH